MHKSKEVPKTEPKKRASRANDASPKTQSAANKQREVDAERIAYQRNLFVMMVLSMSWQLALVVIIPIVGGYYLDNYFHTFPGLLIAGVIVAALGVVGVMIRVVNEANRKTGLKK